MADAFSEDFETFEVLKGYLGPDKWVPPLFRALVVPRRASSGIIVRLWNPDSDPVFAGNALSVAYGKTAMTFRDIEVGKVLNFEILHPSLEGQAEPLSIFSVKWLAPDKADPRAKGTILLEVKLL